jgi:hypothetical protein
MKKLYLYIISVISLCLIIAGCSNDTENMLGVDIRLFKGPAWELAKAVKDDDTTKIKQIIAEHKIKVNYQEPKFGETLLLWAVWTNHYKSSKALLECGADPNLQSYGDGNSAFIYAADKFDTSDYLKLLLAYKGNPNTITKNDSTNMFCTPLITAAYCRLESVKLLVEAGANVNYRAKNYRCALLSAFMFKKVDIVKYLLIDKGADFKQPFGKTIDDDKNIMITDLLRDWLFPLNSNEYKVKMEIVTFLKARGMDYSKASIPQHYYEQYSKDYLSKY